MFIFNSNLIAFSVLLLLAGCGEFATVSQDNQLGAVQNVKLAQATLAPILVDQPYKEIIPLEGMDLPQYQGVTAADFDRDGLMDLISTSRTSQRLPFLITSRHQNISQ
jgi:hypothetical protein